MRLSAKQLDAIIYLISDLNISQVAEKVGVTDSCVYQWLNEPIFKQKLENLKQDSVEAIDFGLKRALSYVPSVVMNILSGNDDGLKIRLVESLLRVNKDLLHTAEMENDFFIEQDSHAEKYLQDKEIVRMPRKVELNG